MQKTILALDIGTTSIKAIVTDARRRIVFSTSIGHDLHSPQPGFAEEDADLWWNHAASLITAIAAERPELIASLSGIGVSGMVPAIVLLDREGRVLRPSIQQNDARAVDEIAELKASIDQMALFHRTGGFTNQQHILPRLLWVKRHEPEIFDRVHTICGSYDFIAFRLTGVRSLEVNWAVESGTYDIRTGEWLTEQFKAYGIDPSFFPPVNDPMRIIGTVYKDVADALGLPTGVPVIAGSADHVASTLAAGIVQPGDLLIKFGGAGDILYCSRDLITDERLFYDRHDVPGLHLLNGCMAASGSLVKWYLGELLDLPDTPDALAALDDAAAQVPAGSDGLVVLPYFLGEKTPLFDPEARGIFFGLTLSHTRAHLFRAILESVIYGFRHHLDVMAESGCVPKRIFATNGGSKSRFWCQIASDVLRRPITSFPGHPGSALGAAFLAGMATGLYTNWSDVTDFLIETRLFTPDPQSESAYEHAYATYRALYPALKPYFVSPYPDER